MKKSCKNGRTYEAPSRSAPYMRAYLVSHIVGRVLTRVKWFGSKKCCLMPVLAWRMRVIDHYCYVRYLSSLVNQENSELKPHASTFPFLPDPDFVI